MVSGYCFCIFFIPLISIRPIFFAFSARFSLSIISIVAFADAQLTGLPPKVEIVFLSRESAISFVEMTAAKGKPFAIPFATVIISGSTP